MKTTQEIYEAMLETVCTRSGFAADDSCDLAVRLYAAAAQLESLYDYADWSRRQCFPQTATGEYLEQHAALHGLTRRAASYAEGVLTLYLPRLLDADVTVPVGTRFGVPDGLYYRTTAACLIAAGELSGTVNAICEQAGAAGNAPAREIRALVDAPAFISSAINLRPFAGGQDAETDEHLRIRVLDACARLPNGSNLAYYEAAAMGVAGITSACAIPAHLGAGTVALCVSAGSSSPTSAQLSAVQAALADRTELGVSFSVLGATVQAVNVAVTIWPVDGAAGAQAVSAVRSAVTDEFDEPILRRGVTLAALGSRIYQTGLVKNYVFTQPAQDCPASPLTLYTLGTLTVSEGA